MGVRGLQAFLENYSPYACYWVDISELAKEYKFRTGREPVIVIDAQSCYRMWYEGMDWLVGYETHEFIIRLRAFVNSFKKQGIRLVFFFGGLNPEKKRETWLERRRKNLKEIHQAFDCLTVYGYIPVNFQSMLPNPGLTTSYILKYVLDCEVYTTIKECDEEIIDYADKHKCFAIFGQDTDFVISQVDAMVLSSRKFEIETMTTLLYDRRNLAFGLGLRVDELPLLAILAGNDLVRYSDAIKEFHRQIGGDRYREVPFRLLMPAISRYILNIRNESLEMKFRRMAIDLFNDLSQVQLLKTSYNSYFAEKTEDTYHHIVGAPSTDKWSKILLTAFTSYRNTRLSVLTEQMFEGGTTFEDLRKHHDGNALVRDQCSSSVLRPLRSRLYGILLFEKDGSNTVREWCNNNVDSYLQPDVVQSIKPEVHHPGLLVLWSDDRKDCINNMRWKLFLTSIHPTINTAECWQSFDKKLLFTTLAVYYLFKREYLNELEMDAVLITIATCPLYNQKRLCSLRYKLYYRAANICITLTRTFGLILTLLAACGYPVQLSSTNAYLKFEGKLFQKKYADVIKKKSSHGALCENNAKSLEVFHRMRNKILEIKDEEVNENFINKMSKMQV